MITSQIELASANAISKDNYQPISNIKDIKMQELDYNFEESFLPPMSRFINLFNILVWKRVIYFMRDKKGLFMEIIIPICIILLGCALLTITFIVN